MRTFLTIIISVIVTAFAFLVIADKRPEWLIKFEYDKSGFPRIRFKGDKFILKGRLYQFDGKHWIEQLPLTASEGEVYTFLDGTKYIFQNGAWVKIDINPPSGGESQRKVGPHGLPISTIALIEASNSNLKQKGDRCQSHTITDLNGNTSTWWSYQGFEVSFADCKAHNKL